MNKARLTYRFDREGLRKEDGELDRHGDRQMAKREQMEETDSRDIDGRDSEQQEEEERLAERLAYEDERALRRAERAPDREFVEQQRPEGRERRSSQQRKAAQPEYTPVRYPSSYKQEEEELYANFYRGNYDSPVEKKPHDRKVVSLFDDDFYTLPEDRQHTLFTDNNRSGWETDDNQETKRIERLIRDSQTAREDSASRNYSERRDDVRDRNTPGSVTRSDDKLESWDLNRRGSAGNPNYHDGWNREPYEQRGGKGRSEAARRYEEEEAEFNRYGMAGRYAEADRYDSDAYTSVKSIRHRNLHWVKYVGLFTGALAFGGLLGYLVLMLLSGSDGATSKLPPESAINQTNGVSGADLGGLAVDNKDVPVTALEANISMPAQSFIMLQNGKFSTAQAAATASQALDQGGYASATETDEFYYVYAGIAADRDSIQPLAAKLKAANYEIYAKEVALPALNHVSWNAATDTLQAYLMETDKVVRMMSGLTLIHLEEDAATPIDAASLQALKEVHQSWSQQAAKVGAGAPETAKAQLQKMHNAINTAVKSLEAYSAKPAASLLGQAQTNLMQCVFAEKDLYDIIAKG
jgi:stage II sporulation protein B